MSLHRRRHRSLRRPVGTVTIFLVTVGILVSTLGNAASAQTGGRYRVREGDTLSGIAIASGVSVAELAAANGIEDRNVVVTSTLLRIPSGSGSASPAVRGHHTVRAGETLSHIAERYGLSVPALAAANGIKNANLVVITTRLAIPAVAGGGGGGSGGGGSGLPVRLRQSPSRLALMPLFDRWAAEYGVPADLLKAVTWLESGWQQGVVSSTEAIGIGQLMPDTVTTMSNLIGERLNPWVPEQNIRMSARYLRLLLDVTGGSTARTLAGYYQGLASVQRNGVYPSTRAYTAGVMALRSRF